MPWIMTILPYSPIVKLQNNPNPKQIPIDPPTPEFKQKSWARQPISCIHYVSLDLRDKTMLYFSTTSLWCEVVYFLVDPYSCDAHGQVWIGGTDSEGTSEGNWIWINDGSSVSGGWYDNEPDQRDRCYGCRTVSWSFGRKKRAAKDVSSLLINNTFKFKNLYDI